MKNLHRRRTRRELGEQPLDDRPPLAAEHVPARHDVDHHQPPRAHARVDGVQVRDAAHEERGPGGDEHRERDLDDREREVTARQELRVVRTLRRELGEVGLAVGATYEAATFGAFGYAVQSSRTVLESTQ